VPCFLACAQALLRSHIAKEDQLADVVQFARNSLAEAAAARGPTDSRVIQAVTRLEASIARGVRTSEAGLAAQLGLANEVAIDRAHLGRLFSRETGLGFREWRRALTMKVAVTRLGDTGEQVAAIAHGLGFEHPGQFDREFRQLFGITPGDYRRLALDVLSRQP
jgi:AraC-like DNA-binding protein